MSRHLHVVRPLVLANLLLAAGAGAARAQMLDHADVARAHVAHGATVAPHGMAQLAASAGCDPSWLSSFGGMPGVNGSVQALTIFDDGDGPALYAGGAFLSAGGVPGTRGVARWDGAHWSSVGGGLNGWANCFLVYDDGQGGGPALYAAGYFTMAGGVPASRIARWDGNTWSPLGGGFGSSPGTGVFALAAFDDGGGPALYASGNFNLAEGQFVRKVAKWDGQQWSGLGQGLTGNGGAEAGWALSVFDDGDGPALYLGGHFDEIDGIPADNIAKWDGQSWSEVGGGINDVDSTIGGVRCLTVLDLGGVPVLYVGGYFTLVETGILRSIGAWDGHHWRNLGTGMASDSGPLPIVYSLTGIDDGAGLKLYAGGKFAIAGGVPASDIASWNGTGWSALGAGVGGSYAGVQAIAAFDDGGGGGPHVFAGGTFDTAGSVPASYLGEWDGVDWAAGGVARDSGLNGSVRALTVFDDGRGGGPALVVGGGFTAAGQLAVNHVAQWDGSSWSALGAGIDGTIYCFAVYDDGLGGGPALYAGGQFLALNHLARWNGATWESVGGGTDFNVRDLEVFDDGLGGGPALYAAGDFSSAGGVSGTQNIAKWNGLTWSTLSGTGMSGGYCFPEYCDVWTDTLAVFDDGTGGGPALFVGGLFSSAGGVPASRIAKWDGQTWSALGSGLPTGYTLVDDLAVFDDGNGDGPALYATGNFSSVGGVPASQIARWNGSNWSALGSGVNSEDARCLAVFDDGTGSGASLFVGGVSVSAGGVPVNGIARWDGATWSGLDDGVDDWVGVMAAADLPGSDGPALYVGGQFLDAGGAGDSFLGRWAGCPVEPSPWHFEGYALAGVAGPPLLAGSGTLVAGSPGTLTLTHAAPSALTVLFISLAGLSAPFKCGTLVPVPVSLQIPLFTNGAGQLPLGWGAWPGGLAGLSLHFQYAVQDPVAVCGVALSNALRADVP